MSVKKQILLPIAAVAAAGVLGAGWVGATALKVGAEKDAVIERSLMAIHQAETVHEALDDAKAVLDDVIAMTRFIDAETALGAFEAQSGVVADSLPLLQAAAQSAAMSDAVAVLAAARDVWVRDARILLGAEAAGAIPTVEMMNRHAADLAHLSETIAAQAQHDALTLSAAAAKRMTWSLAIAAAVMLALTGAAITFALRATRRISSAIVTVADDLRAMTETDADAQQAGDDEIAEMRAAVTILQTELAEKERLSAERRAEEEAQAARVKAAAAFQNDLNAVVSAATAGDLSVRLGGPSAGGDHATVADGMNSLLASVETVATETSRVLKAFATGALTARFEGRHQGVFAELQRDANATGGKLQELVGEIQETSDEIRRSLGAILDGAHGLSRRALSQAASLEETTATMEQMAASVKTNAENAANADALSAKTSTVAVQGGDVASKAVEAIRKVAENARQISDITSLVDGIAFQTNLLALNAAVEAARAGDAGKGFAVVAQEVRTLAQRSADASREIKALVEQSSANVQNGVELVETTGNSLTDIREGISKFASAISEITIASREQSNGVNEITSTMNLIDSETQQNATLASESVAAADMLSRQADRLTELIAFFKAGDDGEVAERARDAAWREAETRRTPPAPPRARVASGGDWSEF